MYNKFRAAHIDMWTRLSDRNAYSYMQDFVYIKYDIFCEVFKKHFPGETIPEFILNRRANACFACMYTAIGLRVNCKACPIIWHSRHTHNIPCEKVGSLYVQWRGIYRMYQEWPAEGAMTILVKKAKRIADAWEERK